MTTNYEKIKNMTVDEMAEFMTKNVHKVGKFYRKDLPRLDVLVYADGFKQWLLQEAEQTTKELEKQFFDTFDIKQREYTQCCSMGCKKPYTDCVNCQYHEIYKVDYPQITYRILLELICIIGSIYICTQDRKTLKEHILVQCMNTQTHGKDIKRQVQALFEEG